MRKPHRIYLLILLFSIIARSPVLAGSKSLATRTLPSFPTGKVVITVKPQSTVKAYAVEEVVPKGCIASELDNNGRADKTGTVLKWGVFFDEKGREFSYKVTCSDPAKGKLTFKGQASFDGRSIDIGGDQNLKKPISSPTSK